MIRVQELTDFLADYLEMAAFAEDYSNNGLQVEGPAELTKIGFAVDASMATFEAAAQMQCDLLIVHHGLSWGAEPRRFTGSDGRRLKFLFEHKLGLYAAHLPLDAHPKVGNNVQLAMLAGLQEIRPFGCWHGKAIGCAGIAPEGTTCRSLATAFQRSLGGGEPGLFLPDQAFDRPVHQVGIMSGSGGLSTLKEAIDSGCDLLITGEMEHTMFHPARESGVAVMALGHYRSETVGIKALLQEIARRWQTESVFLDFPTGL